MKQKMKQKLPRLLAAMLVGVLTITNIGVVPAAAGDGNSAEPVVFQQVDFEGLTASDGDDVSVVIGKINGSTNPMTVSMASETGNKYATLMGGKAGGTFFILREYTGQETGERVLNAAGVEPVVDTTKTLWVTMDIRLGDENYDELRFWSIGKGTLQQNAFFYLRGGKVYDGAKVETDYKISATEWTTIVCEINPTDGKCRTYIVSNGELGNAIYETTFTAADIKDLGRFDIRTTNAETTANVQLDNIAIYQSDEYVDLFAEADEPTEEPVVSVNGTDFDGTLLEAIAAAEEGAVITLLDDITENSIELDEKITLDLNGRILTATYFNAINGTHVIDSSDDKEGRLNVPAGTSTLSSTNSQVPIYIADEGYMFATMFGQSSVSKTDDSFTVISRPSFGSAYEKLAGGADVAKLQFIIRLDWGEVTDGKHEYYQEFVYNNDTVKTVYGNDKAFSVTVNGLTGYTENMKVTVLVRSTDLEVDWVNNEFYMSSAN